MARFKEPTLDIPEGSRPSRCWCSAAKLGDPRPGASPAQCPTHGFDFVTKEAQDAVNSRYERWAAQQTDADWARGEASHAGSSYR
jgi:hypothetical protein